MSPRSAIPSPFAGKNEFEHPGTGAASAFSPVERLDHPAVEGAGREGLEAARLTDRQRLCVVAQGCAVLAHLEHAGWHLPHGWQGATADSRATLRGVVAVPGRSRRHCQELATDLLHRLFRAADGVAGRGTARRSARQLSKYWRQPLLPLSPDLAVEQVFAAAPFLWEAPETAVRTALAARFWRAGESFLWVAGPGPARQRFLARCDELEDLQQLLLSAAARELWLGGHDGANPVELAEDGRWYTALETWHRQPPVTATQRLDFARCVYALGKFETALKALKGLRDPAAQVLAVWCLFYLGRLKAAQDRLRRLAGAALPAELVVSLAEVAIRLLANVGDLDGAREWVARARRASRGEQSWHVDLLAAEAAWDRGTWERMEPLLERSRGALKKASLAWRWHQVKALQGMAQANGALMERSLAEALSRYRRRLKPIEAAALWNEMATARVQQADLAGAERACLHQIHLLRRLEGPRGVTLPLRNLAEVRLRRGRLVGVQEILERSLVQNRSDGNARGAAEDAELWARWELVQGRPRAALATCREALAQLEQQGLDWHRSELHVVSARALGWLGRSEEARADLELTSGEARRGMLEPEERPAVWALAGERERALRAAEGIPQARLWRCALTGEPPPFGWAAVERLEAYRAARLALDLELVEPGWVPAERLQRAVAALRRVGAHSLADLLEARVGGSWQALAQYLEEGRGTRDGIQKLFLAAGRGDVELTVRAGDGEENRLVDGPGGEEEIVARVGSHYATLRTRVLEPVVRALFRLAVGDLPASEGPAPLPPPGTGGMVGSSIPVRRVLKRVALFARKDLPVLVLGESGTGKELMARYIHRMSSRSDGPFVPLSCAALTETLLMSELFGHVRGSFTGAEKDRPGVFETARGGTVFLDEVGDLPPVAQGMFLRVLQEKEVRRVGESLPRHVDVRVVAATHRDLERMVQEGSFRQDLFYRLKVAAVKLPPLRERGGDLLELTQHFLSQTSPRLGGPTQRLSETARRRLQSHTWPGNVRELKNVLEAASALADGGTIEPEHLQLPEAPLGAASGYHESVLAHRKRVLREALAASGGNQAEAARRLGLSRQTLSYLVRKYQIIVPRS